MYYTAKVRLFGDNQSKSGQKSVVCRNRAYAFVSDNGQYTFKNCMVCGGTIKGANDVGGLIGNADAQFTEPYAYSLVGSSRSYYSHFFMENNYCSASVSGTNNVGGLFGITNSGDYTAVYTYNWSSKAYGYTQITPSVTNNRFDGEVMGDTNVGGIIGTLRTLKFGNYSDFSSGNIERNIVAGRVKGKSSVGGIIGETPSDLSFGGKLASNVCCGDTIAATQSEAFCISKIEGGVNNYHLFTTVLISNNKEKDISDSDSNGTGYSLKNLQKKSTYEGIGYNFNTQWSMVEGNSFPYLFSQSAPAWSTSFQEGAKGAIAGKAYGNGKVYVNIGQNLYIGNILDKIWSISLGNIPEGTEAKVLALLRHTTDF